MESTYCNLAVSIFKKYLQSSKEITLIGVNFDSEKGQLIDWQTEDVVQ